MARAKQRHEICPLALLPPGERTIVQIGKRSIGVFNVGGTIYAIKNSCPHQGAELCRGTVGGTMLPTEKPGEYNYAMDGQILRCPWHFWEFDITTGEMIFVPEPYRVKTYDVAVEKPTSASSAPPKDTYRDKNEYALERYEIGIEEEIIVIYL